MRYFAIPSPCPGRFQAHYPGACIADHGSARLVGPETEREESGERCVVQRRVAPDR